MRDSLRYVAACNRGSESSKVCSELVGLGAETVVYPTGGILGSHADTFRLVVLLGLPLWLELAAPVAFSPTASRPRPTRSRHRGLSAGGAASLRGHRSPGAIRQGGRTAAPQAGGR
jgi:hypothetical protein